MWRSVLSFLTSLRLTSVCLVLAMLLVFAGTLAQVEQGLYAAQARYFRSFLVYWSPAGADWKIPVFPGGYLLGGLLVLNLLAVQFTRLKLDRKHLGLWLIHGGLILLLLGQLFTDALSVESGMRLQIGETKNYSEDFRAHELVVTDTSDPGHDRVVSIPERVLAQGGTVPVPSSPLEIRVVRYWPNADILKSGEAGAVETGATEGFGRGLYVLGKGRTTKMDDRDTPAAVLELQAGTNRLGTWLVTTQSDQVQPLSAAGRSYALALRSKRHYTPYSLTLIDCQHDVYKGTDIPRNFSSRVRIQDPRSQEDREVLVYMNNPLRYQGNTYYQYQMDPRQAAAQWSTLQVVRNPSWLTPYVACILVGVGLVIQFLAHLIGFLRERTS